MGRSYQAEGKARLLALTVLPLGCHKWAKFNWLSDGMISLRCLEITSVFVCLLVLNSRRGEAAANRQETKQKIYTRKGSWIYSSLCQNDPFSCIYVHWWKFSTTLLCTREVIGVYELHYQISVKMHVTVVALSTILNMVLCTWLLFYYWLWTKRFLRVFCFCFCLWGFHEGTNKTSVYIIGKWEES